MGRHRPGERTDKKGQKKRTEHLSQKNSVTGTRENNSWPEAGTCFINRPTTGRKTNPKEVGYCSPNIRI